MRLIAVPRIFAERNKATLLDKKDCLVISIIDSDVDPVFPDKKDHILSVTFDDIHPTTIGKVGSAFSLNPMTPKQANQIIEFVMKNKEGKKLIIVHCTAGICRSGAVVDFFSNILDINEEWYKQHNKHIIPNQWVSDLLWCQWLELKKVC